MLFLKEQLMTRDALIQVPLNFNKRVSAPLDVYNRKSYLGWWSWCHSFPMGQ